MFEQFETFHKPVRSKWIRLAIVASVVAHVAAASALIITAAWKIQKLQLDESSIAIASLGMPSAAPPALAGEKREKIKRDIKRTKDIAQQTEATENRDDVAAGSSGDGTADGDPNGEGNSQGTTPGSPIGSVCPTGSCLDSLGDPPPPPKEPTATPKTVPNNMIKGLLESGETQIRPDSKTKTAITRAGKKKLHGIVHTCISKSGRVVSARILQSTGYKAYDRRLTSGVRKWRYRPYKFNGKAIPVCTAINFIYKLERY